jgi:protein-disulfide isomerase
MKNGNLLIALVVGGLIGFVVGKSTAKPGDAVPAAATAAAANKPAAAKPPGGAAEDGNTVYKVPLRDAVTKGPATAKVTIVEVSEFQCPFCSRVLPTMAQIKDTYGEDVRFAFKHNPLPFHADAPLASEAALAAGEQGKFWEMHDKLFANQQKLKREDIESYAAELGLDMARFKGALDSHKFQAQIERDKQEASNFGARGTPTFFINGRKVRGAVPFASFKTVIDEELAKANEALKRGVKADQLYAELTKDGLTEAAPPPAAPQQPQRAPEPPPGSKVSQVKDIEGSPSKGPNNAKVTIVLWSDFQCPFCSRAVPTMEQIVKTYPKDVRFVFKHQPLPFHPNAMPAAIASLAAHQQGKFWEFHDKAFANQQALSDANYKAWAKELGLNMGKFEAALADPKIKAQVEADSQYGSKVGADGTPTFFINGREMAGAMPFESFKAIIDDEIKKADEQLAKGVKPDQLYEKMLEFNAANAPKAPAVAAAPADDGKPVKIDLGSSPVKGEKNAPVTIVEFSDFQCPFCSRVNPTISQIMEKYKGKVKVSFKNQPLPFHENANIAAQAALAAGEQGKYWEMHDKLFANQQALTRPDLERYASELKLDTAKFKAALDTNKFKAQVDADSQLGSSIGANGTPTFFINGRKLVGAQPFEAFAKLIDEELAKK